MQRLPAKIANPFGLKVRVITRFLPLVTPVVVAGWNETATMSCFALKYAGDAR